MNLQGGNTGLVIGAVPLFDEVVISTEKMNEMYPPNVTFEPPDKPHSPYYPERGLYSSQNTTVLAAQMAELAAAGVARVD